ncbi:hypothetical protein FRX31_017896 [Thalictrum thalictroides]|uniref:Uncharacterized protein n=1 Tax=Thalictrum thalictroides TaxID=46969 RepID=A0A7J6W581_THATH|nr:hypothetical protein FRX31_017896 [Thalictrum thalictroides]
MVGLDDKHSHAKQSKTDGKEVVREGDAEEDDDFNGERGSNASDSILQSISVATREKHTSVKMTSYAPMGTNEDGAVACPRGHARQQSKNQTVWLQRENQKEANEERGTNLVTDKGLNNCSIPIDRSIIEMQGKVDIVEHDKWHEDKNEIPSNTT